MVDLVFSKINSMFSFLILRDLNEDPRAIRKRVEKDKATDKDWVAFKQNPARFTQVRESSLHDKPLTVI